MFLMHANSTPSGRYATPRHVKAIDPGAFYAVDSWALARSDSFSAHSCVLSRRGAEGRKLGPGPQRNRLRNRYRPRSTNEEAYNNLQPTYTYPPPLVSKAALVPGSIFDRQGGSKFNRRRHTWIDRTAAILPSVGARFDSGVRIAYFRLPPGG